MARDVSNSPHDPAQQASPELNEEVSPNMHVGGNESAASTEQAMRSENVSTLDRNSPETTNTGTTAATASCLCPPPPEFVRTVALLNAAAVAHLKGHRADAATWLNAANIPAIRAWTESLWGKASPFLHPRKIAGSPPYLAQDQRIPLRMPTAAQQRLIEERDGFHCRFCALPVIPVRVRHFLVKTYPELKLWGRTNPSQHAALQAMWAQFDHVIPHSRGGDNDLNNVVLTCAPCNYGRMDYLCEELGLEDPRQRQPIHTDWKGLTQILG